MLALALAVSVLLTVYGLAVKSWGLGEYLGATVPGGHPVLLTAVSVGASAALRRWTGQSGLSDVLARLRGTGTTGMSNLAWGAVGASVVGAVSFAVTAAGILWFGAPPMAHEMGALSYGGVAQKVIVEDPLRVAIPEELAYRVLLWDLFAAAGRRERPRKIWVPLVGSSIAFGAWHVGDGLQQGLIGVLGAVTMTAIGGAAIGALYAKTRSLAVPVLAHALANAGTTLARYTLHHLGAA